MLLSYLLHHVLKQGVPVSEECVHVFEGVSPYPHPKFSVEWNKFSAEYYSILSYPILGYVE